MSPALLLEVVLAAGLASEPTPAAATPLPRATPVEAHRRLRFLIGEWTVASSDPPARGSVDFRWDLGGLLLVERWRLDLWDERGLWSFDPEAATLRVLRWRSSGLDRIELAGEPAENRVRLERRRGGPGGETVESLSFELRKAATPGSTEVLLVERRTGLPGGEETVTFRAELRKNIR